jgi:hypothetical protein
MNCECHKWTVDDERVWRLAKNQPRTLEQWALLHDYIERYKRQIVEDYRQTHERPNP